MMKAMSGKLWSAVVAGLLLAVVVPALTFAGYIITGNDNKALVVEGRLVIHPEGKQSVSLIDISGKTPMLKVTLPILNSQDVSVLKVDGKKVTDTGKNISLPGRPGSMRGRAR